MAERGSGTLGPQHGPDRPDRGLPRALPPQRRGSRGRSGETPRPSSRPSSPLSTRSSGRSPPCASARSGGCAAAPGRGRGSAASRRGSDASAPRRRETTRWPPGCRRPTRRRTRCSGTRRRTRQPIRTTGRGAAACSRRRGAGARARGRPVSAAWVAGSVRARLLLERRAGPAPPSELARGGVARRGARGLCRARSTRRRRPPATLEEAQRAVAALHCSAAPRARRVAAARAAPGSPRARRAGSSSRTSRTGSAYLAGRRRCAAVRARRARLGLGRGRRGAERRRSCAALLARLELGRSRERRSRRRSISALRFAWARRVARAGARGAARGPPGAAAILLAEELFVAGRRSIRRSLRRAELGTWLAGRGHRRRAARAASRHAAVGARRDRRAGRALAGRARAGGARSRPTPR